MLERYAGLANGWLEQENVERANLIRDAAYADPGKNATTEEFEAGIAFLRRFAANRSAFVLAEIARLRTQP